MPDLLRKEVESLVARLRLWTPTRWAATCEPWGTRADLGRHLAQSWADLAADREGGVRRQLPVLTPHLLVADQLAVTGDDLVRTQPEEPLVRDLVAHLLAHRLDLLGEDAPASLGGADAVVRGRRLCAQPEWDKNASTS